MMKTTVNHFKSGLISVVIPCYNAAQTLTQTVQSVCQQTYTNWELIIVNDGSTDNSGQVADYLANTTNVFVIHTANQGVSCARNTGAQHAHGEYLAFLDADDIWYPEKLQKQFDYFVTHPELGVCFSKVQFTSPTGDALNQYSSAPTDPLNAFALLVENPLCTSSNIMCRKQAFLDTGHFEPGMNYAEDQEWLLRMVLKTNWQIVGLPIVLMDYRTQVGSLSSSLEKMEQGWQLLVQKVTDYAPEFIQQHYTQAQAIYLRYLARRALRQGEPAATGLTYMKRALCADWTLCIKSPWRSIATLMGLFCWYIAPTQSTAQLFRIAKKTG